VSTPTNTHKDYVNLCLRHEKPVFCEKPFTLTYDEETLSFKKWTTRHNELNRAMLFIGYIERYNPVIDTLYLYLHSVRHDPTDKILHVSVRRVNWVDPKIVEDREIISDLGVHDFDLLNLLFDKVNFTSARVIENNNKAVFSHINFLLSPDVFCNSVLSWIDTDKRREYVVYTQRKVISVNLIAQKLSVLNRDSGQIVEFSNSIEPAYSEMKSFLTFARTGDPLILEDPLGLEAQKMVIEVLNNAHTVKC